MCFSEYCYEMGWFSGYTCKREDWLNLDLHNPYEARCWSRSVIQEPLRQKGGSSRRPPKALGSYPGDASVDNKETLFQTSRRQGHTWGYPVTSTVHSGCVFFFFKVAVIKWSFSSVLSSFLTLFQFSKFLWRPYGSSINLTLGDI